MVDHYDVFTGEPLIEQTGVYPRVNLNGHTAVNTRNFGLGEPANINLAGGAASLIANPKSYRAFLDALVNGGLLNPTAQSELNSSYIVIPDFSNPEVTVSNGFGIVKIELRGYGALEILISTSILALYQAYCVRTRWCKRQHPKRLWRRELFVRTQISTPIRTNLTYC